MKDYPRCRHNDPKFICPLCVDAKDAAAMTDAELATRIRAYTSALASRGFTVRIAGDENISIYKRVTI